MSFFWLVGHSLDACLSLTKGVIFSNTPDTNRSVFIIPDTNNNAIINDMIPGTFPIFEKVANTTKIIKTFIINGLKCKKAYLIMDNEVVGLSFNDEEYVMHVNIHPTINAQEPNPIGINTKKNKMKNINTNINAPIYPIGLVSPTDSHL